MAGPTSLADDLRAHLAPLLDDGTLTVLDETRDDDADEARVLLGAGPLRLRLTRERDLLWLDAAPADAPPSWWYDAGLVAEVLGIDPGEAAAAPLETPERLAALAAFVRAHLGALRDAFSPARADATLAALDERRRDDLTAWWEDRESRGI